MADLSEVAALLHVHKALQEHGDMFPNLKSHVLNSLRSIEADHAPIPETAEEPEPEEETADE